jgi:hypothetical protein
MKSLLPTLGGIACTLQPIILAIPGSSPHQIGQDCDSKDYDAELKRDVKYAADSSGKTLHSRFELYDIQVGVAPDPKLFNLTRFDSGRVAHPFDTAVGYANDVLGGPIVAGKFVRLACKRFLDDLQIVPPAGFASTRQRRSMQSTSSGA